jgi:hypothetical protein
MSLAPNEVNPVCLLRKIMTRLRGTKFCTTSACFAPSFVRQPNGPKCIQIVQNTPKHEFRVQWGGWVRSLRKIPTRLRGTNFCTRLGHFTLSVVTQPNSPKCTEIVRNAPKQKVRVQWVGSNGLLWKILTRLQGTNFCTTSGHFAQSFVRQPNGNKCTQIVRNGPKHYFRSQRGQSGVFVVKN